MFGVVISAVGVCEDKVCVNATCPNFGTEVTGSFKLQDHPAAKVSA